MKYNGTDKYCYESHPGILINHFGITDDGLLDLRIIKEQMNIIDDIKISPLYSLNTLCYMHRQMFSCAFDWAGKLRDIDISKGSTRFCNNSYIVTQGESIFIKLNELHNILLSERALDKITDSPVFILRMSELGWIISDLNMLHPFREGNGRTLRLFIELFLYNLGIIITWPESPERWMNASINDDAGEFTSLLLDYII
ncbi:cell filamentation protein [Serratia sp. S1B]|nr:cell filamentation protein [Serratia sp. S1B]